MAAQTPQVLIDLQALLVQVSALTPADGGDLVGREMQVMERSLRRLLRELGVRDTVDSAQRETV
jgi:hypothetical protein